MKSYEDLGYDNSLRKIGGISSGTNNFQTAYSFNANNDNSIISTPQLREISADKITSGTIDATQISVKNLSFGTISGGTCNLGGTVNGNGVLSVKNAAGTEVVKLDNTGITVSGSVTIKDSSGSTVIDSSGVNSLTSFQSGEVTLSDTRTTTNTSFEAVSGLSLTLNLARSTKLLISSTLTGRHLDVDGCLVCHIRYNGTAVSPDVIAGKYDAQMGDISGHVSCLYAAPSGAGTIAVWFRQNNTGGTGVLDATFLSANLNYVALGK